MYCMRPLLKQHSKAPALSNFCEWWERVSIAFDHWHARITSPCKVTANKPTQWAHQPAQPSAVFPALSAFSLLRLLGFGSPVKPTTLVLLCWLLPSFRRRPEQRMVVRMYSWAQHEWPTQLPGKCSLCNVMGRWGLLRNSVLEWLAFGLALSKKCLFMVHLSSSCAFPISPCYSLCPTISAFVSLWEQIDRHMLPYLSL